MVSKQWLRAADFAALGTRRQHVVALENYRKGTVTTLRRSRSHDDGRWTCVIDALLAKVGEE